MSLAEFAMAAIALFMVAVSVFLWTELNRCAVELDEARRELEAERSFNQRRV